MAATNTLWGAPRIYGELLKLGIEVAERTDAEATPAALPEGMSRPLLNLRTE